MNPLLNLHLKKDSLPCHKIQEKNLAGVSPLFQIASEEIKNQALEQTSLLSSINEKMSALCTIPETVGSDSVINSVSSSDGLREMLLSSLAQHDNFSGQIVEQLVACKR